ncbi:MAG: M48 family metallopeptidase [Granulosicoccus sp.]
MILAGHWFEPDSSTRHDADLVFLGDRYELRIDGKSIRQGNASDFSVSDRLGNLPRRLSWNDDAVFETTNNDAIDAWLDEHGHSGSRGLLIHHLEKSWKWAAVGCVLTVAIVFGAFRWGLPSVSKNIADNVPVSVHESLSKQTLETLDRFILEESEVDIAEQVEIRARFEEMVAALPAHDFSFKLHFRRMKDIPNAMALPGGDVIVTDELLDLVQHPDELDSILLHEMGHVVERHGLQHAVQASAVSVVVALAFGDLSGIGEVGVGLPVFLLQSSYSRHRETEADAFAFARMGELGKDPKYFASVITRLGGSAEEEDSSEDEERAPAYFSSHPHSAERAIKAMKASKELGFPRP